MSATAPPAARCRRGRGRSPGRRAVATVVALVVLVGLAGCGDDGGGEPPTEASPSDGGTTVPVEDADVGPFDVDPDDLGGPGTPLGGGLSVPEGALLQGTTFPDLVGDGFRALLLVVGDPVVVHDEMSDQALDLGMQGSGACLGSPTEMGCTARFADPADGESLAFSVAREVGPNGVVSGLGLQYRPPGSDEVPDAEQPGAVVTPPLPEVVLPDPVPTPDPLDVGRALRAPGSPTRTVELGSELVGLPGPCACDGPGWSFVVALDGVARDILAGYGRQFSDLGDPPDLEDRHGDDVTLVGLRVGEGGQAAEIRAVLPDDGTSYAIVNVRTG